MASEQTDCELFRRAYGFESLKGRKITFAIGTYCGYEIMAHVIGKGHITNTRMYKIMPGCEDGEILCDKTFKDVEDFRTSNGLA